MTQLLIDIEASGDSCDGCEWLYNHTDIDLEGDLELIGQQCSLRMGQGLSSFNQRLSFCLEAEQRAKELKSQLERCDRDRIAAELYKKYWMHEAGETELSKDEIALLKQSELKEAQNDR